MKVSVICVFNNPEQLSKQLINSLNRQDVKFEIIKVDGRCNRYKSAAQALNYGASVAKGDVLIFSHQDIVIEEADGLKRIANFIHEKPIGSVIGVAGAIEGNRRNKGNYISGNDTPERIKNPVTASTVDECFFGMRRDTYELHHFDEFLCDDWHLYAVEQCLYHRKDSKIYIYPIKVHHYSPGKISLKYMDGLIKLADHYHGNYKYIWTTCYKIKSNPLTCRLLRNAWLINRIVRRKGY